MLSFVYMLCALLVYLEGSIKRAAVRCVSLGNRPMLLDSNDHGSSCAACQHSMSR